jgi:hypothetical protein
MANTILTPTAVTREALRILHQKLRFIPETDLQYDDQYAQTGAKIGTDLKIRTPNQYVIRKGASLSAQDTVESSTTLTVASQYGVDLNFTSVDLTLSLDDFGKRILDPAMAVLAANIESDALSILYKDVYNTVTSPGNSATFNNVLSARKLLVDNLAPSGEWTVNLQTQDNLDLVDALKGLFQSSDQIASAVQDRHARPHRRVPLVREHAPADPRQRDGAHLVLDRHPHVGDDGQHQRACRRSPRRSQPAR